MPNRICLLVTLFAALVASARDKAENWLEVRSPHFVVLSDSSEKQARHVADQFERMRTVFHAMFPQAHVDPGTPIVVLAVKDKKDFQSLEPEAYLAKGQLELAGLFLRAPDKNYILLRLDAQGEHPYATVYHEYTHLLSSRAEAWLPLWLNEGLAEFYQNTDIRDKEVLLGEPSTGNILLLRQEHLLPLPTLFTIDYNSPYYHEENKGSIFYAESWALTHYFQMTDYQKNIHRLTDYAELVGQKVDAVTAATRVFGDLTQLQETLEKYVSQRSFYSFKASISTEVDDTAFKVQALSSTQADAVRADFLAYNRRVKDARTLLERVLRDDPSNAPAHETMGYLEFREGNLDEARKWYGESIKLDSNSFLAYYYFAVITMNRGQLNSESKSQVENSLRAAIKLNPSFAPAYEKLAMFFGMQRENLEEADMLILNAVQLDPGNLRYRLNTANILLQMQRGNDAMRVLQNAMSLAKTPEEVNSVQNLLRAAQQRQSPPQTEPSSTEQKQEAPASNSNTQGPTQPDTTKAGGDYGLGLGRKATAAMGPLEVLTDTMGVDFGPYLQRVLHDIRENWYNLIPVQARAPLMKKGKVTIEFAIKKDGSVAGMQLISTSGDVALDRGAWGGIIASNPFPPLPNEFGGQYIGLRFAFYYNPNRSDLDTSPTSLDVANVNEPAYFYFQEALAASNEGDYTRAIDGFKQVLALNPTYPAWNELGRTYLRQDQLDSAAAAFRKQIQINASDPFAYNNLGLTLERQEQWEEAIKSFRSQLQINPDDRYAHANLGYLLEKRRDYANAMPELQKAISISPNSAPLLVALANAYCQSAQEEKCRSTLNQAAMIADTPENWNSLAWYMAVRNLKLDEALKYAQRAVASIATSLSGVSLDHITNQDLRNVSALASYWDTLGWVYFQRGDLPPAERYLLAAWQLRHDGVIGDHLGELYEKLGRKDDGVRYYSLSLGAANPEAGTRDRIIALAGKDAVSDEKLARYHNELAELGFLQVARAGAADTVADFYIAFVPGPGSAISDVRFICGNENLKSATDLLRSASYQVSFPDSQPVKLIRRVETVCSARDKRCSLKLLSPSVASREPIDAPGTLEILGDTMGVDFSSYVETLIKTVLPNWYELIPQEPQAPEMKKGKVSIGFAIQKDGKLGHVDISRSSGDLELDRAAFDAILKSAPFSALPLGFARSSLSFRFHFSHNLGPDSCANGDSYPRADNSASIPAPNVGASRGGAFKVGGGVSPPRAVFAPDPEYSEEARKAHYQGTSVLWVVIGPDGRVRDLRVARALGRGLDEKAMEAVKTWKFEPAMKDGKPVAVQINVEITFRLYGVVVSPTSAQLATGAKQQFSATVPGGATNSALKWSVGGSGCAASACGSISTDGLYTAPLSVPNPATVIVTATLGTDPTNIGSATVTIQPSPSP